MIQAIIFDFDGMFYHESTDRFTERFFVDFPQVNQQNVISFFQNELPLCQKGEKDMKEILQRELPEWGYPGSVAELLEYWFSDGERDQNIVQLIEKLKKQGIFCVLCTNNEIYRWTYMKSKYKLETLFDLLVCACDVGMKKPDPQMYTLLEEQIPFPKKEILFCDDGLDRVEMAQKLGFQGHQYKNFEMFQKLFL